jgi:hypothetical protein
VGSATIVGDVVFGATSKNAWSGACALSPVPMMWPLALSPTNVVPDGVTDVLGPATPSHPTRKTSPPCVPTIVDPSGDAKTFCPVPENVTDQVAAQHCPSAEQD